MIENLSRARGLLLLVMVICWTAGCEPQAGNGDLYFHVRLTGVPQETETVEVEGETSSGDRLRYAPLGPSLWGFFGLPVPAGLLGQTLRVRVKALSANRCLIGEGESEPIALTREAPQEIRIEVRQIECLIRVEPVGAGKDGCRVTIDSNKKEVSVQVDPAQRAYFAGFGRRACSNADADDIGVCQMKDLAPLQVRCGLRGCSRDGFCWANPLPQGNRLYATWDTWAVGEAGTILRWDGYTWSAQQSGIDQDLYAVWGTDGMVWSAGQEGVILRLEGSEWQVVRAPSPGEPALRALSGTSVSDVWAAGEKGTVLHFQGQGWQPALLPEGDRPTLRGVWASAQGVWVVGDGCAVRRRKGTEWEKEFANCTGLHAIWGTDGSVLAVGEGSTLLRRRPATKQWEPEPVEKYEGPLLSIAGMADGKQAWAVGKGGVLRLDSDGTWRREGDKLVGDLEGVAVSAAGVVWVVGEAGAIYERIDREEWRSHLLQAATLGDELNGIGGRVEMDGRAEIVAAGGRPGQGVVLGLHAGLRRFLATSGMQINEPFSSLWLSADGDLWFAGKKSIVHRHEGKFQVISPPALTKIGDVERSLVRLNAVWGSKAGVWVVGETSARSPMVPDQPWSSAVILRAAMTAAPEDPLPAASMPPLVAVAGSGADVWAAGQNPREAWTVLYGRSAMKGWSYALRLEMSAKAMAMAGTDLWVVGDKGEVWRVPTAGGMSQRVEWRCGWLKPDDTNFHGVATADKGTVIVGQGGVILDLAREVPCLSSGTRRLLHSIWRGVGQTWIAGERQAILFRDDQ